MDGIPTKEMIKNKENIKAPGQRGDTAPRRMTQRLQGVTGSGKHDCAFAGTHVFAGYRSM